MTLRHPYTIARPSSVPQSPLVVKAGTLTLGPGGFYTEPAGQPHYAFTGDLPTVVYITGQGPTDTTYAVSSDAASHK
jgi:hypothetical protein